MATIYGKTTLTGSESSIHEADEKDIARPRRSQSTLHIDGEADEEDEGLHLKGEKDGNVLMPVKSIQQVLSRRSTRASRYDPGPPPDGGMIAWLQVLQGHLCIFNTMGFAGSYGLFEGYYTNPASPFPNLTSSIWAWPGGLQISLMCLLGGVSGRLFDAGYYRQVIMFGFFMQLLGVFTSSFAQSYVPILLSQGLCQGIGNGFVLCPTMSLLSTYFAKRRVTAISLVASGSASGGVVFPLISQHLLPKVGFGWTVRIMGFVMLANVAIILSLARKRIDGRRSGPWVELAAFKEPPYTLFICGMFCIFLALYFAFTYVNLYAKNVLGTSTETSLTILLLLNAIGLPGRVLPAIIADSYLGPMNTLIPSALILAVMFFVWISITSLTSLYPFVIFFGFVDASVQGLFMGSVTSLTKDLSKIGTRVGMAMSILAFAALGGPPIAGKLIDISGGSFLNTQIFGGVAVFVGVALLTGARFSETGLVLKKRM